MKRQENNASVKQNSTEGRRSERRRPSVTSQQKECKPGDPAVREMIETTTVVLETMTDVLLEMMTDVLLEMMTDVLLEMMTDVLLEMMTDVLLEMTTGVLLEMIGPMTVVRHEMLPEGMDFAAEMSGMRIEGSNVSLLLVTMPQGPSAKIANLLAERRKLRMLGRNLRMMATMADSQWFAARSESGHVCVWLCLIRIS